MTLPTGTISLSQANTELGNPSTSTISLNDTDVRVLLARVPSGTISMSDLQGKTVAFSMSGGTSWTSGGYTYRAYTSTTGITVTGSGTVEAMVVGGGGIYDSPPTGTARLSGGAGAGGLRFTSFSLDRPNSVTVGGSGSPSRITFGPTVVPVSIVSAAGGATEHNNADPGGSGGGESGSGGGIGFGNSPPVTPPQGNPGGPNFPSGDSGGGGGGGAGASGGQAASPGVGGVGGVGATAPPSWSIPPSYGTPGPTPGRYFAGGGGGVSGGAGGAGGGGPGGVFPNGLGTAGTTNTGGGAGGSNRTYLNVNGGSGIVIVRYIQS